MPTQERWLLPEGIEELMPPEAARLNELSRSLVDLYASWGYDLVVPPFIEYLESLLTATGHELDLQTFKVTDQLTGRLMGVRADMTPQVARIDAHHMVREGTTRLCYLGEVLHTRPDGCAGTRSPLQVGAELYGHRGPESDVEVLCLLLETMRMAGISDVHLDLGHVGIYRGLARQAGLDRQQEQALFDALQRKADPEIDELVSGLGLADDLTRMLHALASLNGGVEVLGEAERVLADAEPAVQGALADVSAVYRGVRERLPNVPLYFDLAELRGYHYQTGVVFAAFVPGHGQEIARGGRYDAIGRVFGRARPATGFSTDLKTLVKLSDNKQEHTTAVGIIAPWSSDPGLAARVRELRAAGERVVYELPGESGATGEQACDRRLVGKDGAWEVEALQENEGRR